MRLLFAFMAMSLLAGIPKDGRTTGEKLSASLAAGRLFWRLSEPTEVKETLGAAQKEEATKDGGSEVLIWSYGSETSVIFWREAGGTSPFVLSRAKVAGAWTGPRPEDLLVLRNSGDLAKLRAFSGLQGVDASRTDLSKEGARLTKFPFDTLTRWPPKERLPKGFDPAALLEAGRNPGLGVRGLHAQGIDGRGVEIGIIDQPLVKDHPETVGRLEIDAELEVAGVPPQMHGPAVTSLAAGRSCGVAPGAKVHFISMAMWKSKAGNQLYLQALEKLLELNRTHKARIRAVSISYGGFASAPDAKAWKAVLARAEAEGVLVITCDLEATGLDYGLLNPLPGGDRDKPEGYTQGSYGRGLLVPGDGRTYAHNIGQGSFAYGPRGGMSWGAPWLAGLAALGFQVNPDLTPARARAYLQRSFTEMPFGKVVDPAAFIQLCKRDPDATRPARVD